MPADVSVRVAHVADTPGRALTETAGASDLLVIGSGGGGPLRGGTRRYCTRHTRCPLVIVPRPDAGELLGSPVRSARRQARDLRGRWSGGGASPPARRRAARGPYLSRQALGRTSPPDRCQESTSGPY